MLWGIGSIKIESNFVNAIFISIFLSNQAALIDDDTPGFGEEENPKQFR